MKKQHIAIYFLSTLFLVGCGPKITSHYFVPKSSLGTNEKVALLDLHHTVPENATKIGTLKFGDTGFSTNCSFKKNSLKAIEEARKNGVNIIKITQHKKPDLMSSCHRMVFELYYYAGNTQKLSQLTL
jgi:hypothetical protein